MKYKKRVMTMILAAVMLLSSLTAFAASGTVSGTTNNGKYYTGEYSVTTTRAYGKVNCSGAYTCGVQLKVNYGIGSDNRTYTSPATEYAGHSYQREWSTTSSKPIRYAYIYFYVDGELLSSPSGQITP